ncbi:hypothetical protein KFU94_40250 [Chloroflexi bacterium TSY]|nr:hypothetical protein [Chloroflexi bacterium TSY]
MNLIQEQNQIDNQTDARFVYPGTEHSRIIGSLPRNCEDVQSRVIGVLPQQN